MRARALAPLLSPLLLVSCGGGVTARLCDADAGMTTSTVRIECPATIELGCITGPTAPLPLTGIHAVGCDGAHVTTTCSMTAVPPGDTSVTCTAGDLFGHEASCVIHVHATAHGTPALTCVMPAATRCTAPLTPVALHAPSVDTSCGTATGTPTSDAPAAGFPVGTSHVTWSLAGASGGTSTCLQDVTVVDDTAPTITCPPSGTVAPAVPGTPATPPPATAMDGCDAHVDVTAVPPTLASGTTTVTYTARDDAGLTATCTASFTVVDAPPVTGLRVLAARETEGVTSVTIGWARTMGADATGYRLEVSPAATGPFTTVATTTIDRLILTDPALPGDHAYYRVVTLATGGDGGAPAPVLAHAVDEAMYDLEGEHVPRVAFPTSLYGVVRHPRDLANGPYPLVLLIHGNHGNCRPVGYPGTGDDDCAELTTWQCTDPGHTTTPNEAGLVYLAGTLAAKGYIAVTVNANALNCRETGGETDGWIRERSQLLLTHMQKWQLWATSGAAPFGSRFVGSVDTGRVGLFGHSRGGEAVAAVPDELRDAPLPGIAVGSIFSLAPTTHWTDPTPGDAPYTVLVPACDGDVASLEGITLYDRKRVLLDGTPQSQLFVNGANHDFFSTEWRFDDNGDGANCNTSVEIGATAQQGFLEGAVGSWFDHTIGTGDRHVEDFEQADDVVPGAINQYATRDIDVRVSYQGRDVRIIADETEAGAPATNALLQPDTFSPSYYVARRCTGTTDCDANFPHDVPAMFLSWMSPGEVAHWGLGALDASRYDALSFRIVSRRSTLNSATMPTMDLVVRLTDADGTVYSTTLGAIRPVPHLYASNQQREVFQTERIDLRAVAAAVPALDLSRLASFELEMSTPARMSGSVLITDIELSRD